MTSDAATPDGAGRPLLADEPPQNYGVLSTNDTATPSSRNKTHATFNRNLGTLEAFAIIIGVVIGSGVFTSPGSIDTNVPSPGIALVIWLIGGLLAWTGAATLAELGTAIPGEGLLIQCKEF
jgi:amino acid permease